MTANRLTECSANRRRFGRETLGPIFAAFSHLLLLEARERKFTRLAFVARDGELLRLAAQSLVKSFPELDRFDLDYVHLSRRAVSLPAIVEFNAGLADAVLKIRAGGSPLERFLAYYNLELPPGLQHLGSTREGLSALIADPQFRALAAEQGIRHKELLRSYLAQKSLLDGSGTCLVDIGWSGSIQQALNIIRDGDSTASPICAMYLGLWAEVGETLGHPPNALGILTDRHRGRSILEGSGWHLAALLESICRAPHGAVTGYQKAKTGEVVPMLDETSSGRLAERMAEPCKNDIRDGIFAFLEDYGKLVGTKPFSPHFTRRHTQRRMLRLAFFPKPWEIAAVEALVHTETHAGPWHVPLICKARPHPFRAPAKWLAGLASPWRGGYVAATGGWFLSLAALSAEGVLSLSPPALRNGLRSIALKHASHSPEGIVGKPKARSPNATL